MDACGNTLGNEEKWPWWRSRLQGDEVCGQAWYSSPFGGDLKIFSILVHHANYYPVALDFDREIAKRPTYGDYVVTEINEFGEASYVLENRGMNKITFKQSAYTIDIFAPKGFCSLDQLKTLSRIAEKRIS